METVGLGFCYEDLPVGREFRTIGRTVTETDITNFVSVTGMLEVLFINSDFREKDPISTASPPPARLSIPSWRVC